MFGLKYQNESDDTGCDTHCQIELESKLEKIFGKISHQLNDSVKNQQYSAEDAQSVERSLRLEDEEDSKT